MGPVPNRISGIQRRSPVQFKFNKATWLHHGQGYLIQDDPRLVILWWVSRSTVHSCFDYGTIVFLGGQYHESYDWEDL